MARRVESGILLADMESIDDPQYNSRFQRRPIRRKPVANMAIDTISSSDRESNNNQTNRNLEPSSISNGGGDAWTPGFWTQFPSRGVLALLTCLACIAASIAILVKSDGQPTSHCKQRISLFFLLTHNS